MYGCIDPEPVDERSGADPVDRREAVAGGGAVEPRGDRPIRVHAGDLRRAATDDAGHGGEIQLTDAINLLAQEQAVYAYRFEGRRFDVGNPLDT